MGKLIDLTGKRFGRLQVVMRSGSKNGNAMWLCHCDCGNTKTVCGVELRSGETESCGCLHKEIVSKKMTKHNGSHTERLYRIWGAMLSRTRNSNASNYQYYGARGIKVCEEWEDYEKFRSWSLQNGYNPSAQYGKCTLDRIDTNGNYCPENCRWVDMSVQNNNQRTNKKITYNNETHNLKQWSDILGINYSTFKKYIKNGKTIEDMVNESTK